MKVFRIQPNGFLEVGVINTTTIPAGYRVDFSVLKRKADGSFYNYYTETIEDGLLQPNILEDDELIKNRKVIFSRATKQLSINNIRVTVNDKVFDGDELSQTRMSKKISLLEPLENTIWKLANNKEVEVSREELKEALKLADIEQSRLWMTTDSQASGSTVSNIKVTVK